MQAAFDFSVDQPPHRGRTRSSREASLSGARKAVRTWSAKSSAMLQVLSNGGPMTRNELAALLGWPISSVCSKLAGLMKAGQIESNGDCQIVTWDDGEQTKRERFRIRR